jgi:hypothetical protein
MSTTRNLKSLVITTALPLMYLARFAPDAPAGLALLQEAHAVVGAPLTPVSVAGVARRTTRRVVVAETSATQAAAASTAATQQQQAATAQQQSATAQQQSATAQQQAATAQQHAAAARPAGAPASGAVVTALPAGCKPEIRDGVEYQNCGGVYYRAAFQGNNLVYVVQ